MKGDTLPRNALLESPTSVSLIKKLITIQRIGDEERRASADLSWNDEEEKEEINNENRQADTKDLTSSSKVLRVLGPNLTDASYL